jgi:hypothetical protein
MRVFFDMDHTLISLLQERPLSLCQRGRNAEDVERGLGDD